MTPIRSCPVRRGFTLVDVVVAATALILMFGLLLPALLNAREEDKAAKSQRNLKELGIAINGYAAAYNNHLPNAGNGVPSQKNTTAPYWFCGYGYGAGGAEIKGPSAAPGFVGGILSQMEGNTKFLVAPEDVNVGNSKPANKPCCYSIPAQWAKLSGGTGNLLLPASFPRGVSQSLAVAEMTTQDVAYTKIRPFDRAPYTLAQKDKVSKTANSFSVRGCQIVLMDGSVRLVKKGANGPKDGDFIIAQDPSDAKTKFSDNW